MLRVEVSACGRVHFGLADTSGQTPRVFGGIGAMLEEPRIVVRANAAKQLIVHGLESEDSLGAVIASRVNELLNLVGLNGVELEITGTLPRHVGLGSATATVMACLQATASLSGVTVDSALIRRLSRRGGASGTGVNGFDVGGWIVDAGQPGGTLPLPSGSTLPTSPALMTMRIDPPDWILDLYIPPGVSTSGSDELTFFKREARAVGSESLQALALLHHGLVPALLEDDLTNFGNFMDAYQGLGFKRREIEAQADSVRNCMAELRSAYPCVGMSSFGPLLAAIRRRCDPIPDLSQAQYLLTSTLVTREGARIKWVA